MADVLEMHIILLILSEYSFEPSGEDISFLFLFVMIYFQWFHCSLWWTVLPDEM